MKEGQHQKGLITDVSAPKVTAVIPTWNNLWLTKRMFESIANFWTIPYKLVFVDNGSTDGTREWLKKIELANPDKVTVIQNHTNTGFAHATNQGMEHVKGHMLWLNNDVEFLRQGGIEELVKSLEDTPLLGAVGPVSDMVMGPQTIALQMRYPPFHVARFLIGFCMLVREEAWKTVGKLDTGFNNAGQDDLDYSIRIRQAGYSLGVNRNVFVHHVGLASQPKDGSYQSLQSDGRQKLVEKWGEEVVQELFMPVDFTGLKVMVCVPTWLSLYPEAYANHVGMFMEEMKIAQKTGLEIAFVPLLRSSIVTARNELVRKALAQGCSHLFFLDDDMLLPPGAIHKLVQRNLPIVTAECHLRTAPHFPSAFISPDNQDGRVYYLTDIWEQNKDEVIEIDAAGSACMMIKTEVFEDIARMEVPGNEVICPHCDYSFHDKNIKDAGQDLWYLYGRARPGENTVGEDIFFCKLAKKAGYRIFLDKTIELGHIGYPNVYDANYFKKFRAEHGGDLGGLVYTTYEEMKKIASGDNELPTPGDLAERLGGPEGRRVLAGQVGDGKNPGSVAAKGNGGRNTPRGPCSPV